MTTQEMKARYAELYENMAESKDVSKMMVFGTAFTQMFDKVAMMHPDVAMATLDFLASLEYNNFVTPAEAMTTATKFVNDDTIISGASQPSTGAHWSMDTLKTFLAQKGLPLEEKPYYNWSALWLTTNMIYSDYAEAFHKLLGTKDNERLATASYTFAVKKLKDKDRPHFIRRYFDLDF